MKNLHVSSQNLSCSSTLSLAAHIEEEVELNCKNYDKKSDQIHEVLWKGRAICSETNTSNVSNTFKFNAIFLFVLSLIVHAVMKHLPHVI